MQEILSGICGDRIPAGVSTRSTLVEMASRVVIGVQNLKGLSVISFHHQVS